MKSFCITLLALTLFTLPAIAGCSCYQCCHPGLHCLETHINCYGNKVTHKAGSGLANVGAALALTDVVEGVSDGMFIGTSPCKSVAYGIAGGMEGLGHGAYRLIAGAFELVTAPVPFLGPVRYPRKNYFDEYREPVAYGTVSPYALISSIVPD